MTRSTPNRKPPVERPASPERLSIGRIVGAHGVRGTVKLKIWTHFPEILGLQVVDEAGNVLGRVIEILETGANDVYVVQRPDGSELLLPALRSVILAVDLEQQRLVVRPPRYYDEE
jgi:ribosomal 30S subunit maturation factor RimM